MSMDEWEAEAEAAESEIAERTLAEIKENAIVPIYTKPNTP